MSLDVTPALIESSPATEAPARLYRCDRIEVRGSGVHGRDIYVVVAIACGKKIIEYKGEHITWKEVLCRHPHNPSDPNHTSYFSLEDGSVIDARYGGNCTCWINHVYEPNCEAWEADDHMLIHALRDTEADEELFHDYGLAIENR